MTDVDAIWQEMKQQQQQSAATRDAVERVLRKSAAPSSAMAKASRTSVAKAKTTTTTEKPNEHSTTTAAGDDTTRSTPPQAFNLQREMNRLADEHGSVRKKAALALEAHFLLSDLHLQDSVSSGAREDDDDCSNADTAVFAEIAKPLFKRFNDPVEKVREVSIRVATRLIAREQDLLRFLPYLMPAVTARLNSQYAYDEQQQQFTRDQFLHDAFKRGRVFVDEDQVARLKPDEPSEEIRLLFLDLLAALLENAFACNASSILHAYIFDILVVLVSGVHDAFHDVNMRACAILRAISNNMVSVMKHFSVAAVRAVKDLLLHRLARVRIAAIDTIRALVSCPNRDKCKGSGTEAIVDLIGHRDDNVIPIAAFYTAEVRLNYFAKLNQDANPLVRKAFFDMVGDWITNLPDRYDHESRLMPYLLSAVSDESDGISRDALATLAVLGTRYEQEHGEEVLEMKQYGVDGRNPSYNYRKALPAPFGASRPSLGTRLYVRGRARRFLNPILRELGNWQTKTRSHAVRLLKSIIVYCEETITVDAHLLLQTLLRVWREPDIARDLRVIAELVGRFVAPDTYMPLLLARVRGDSEVSVTGGVVAPEQTAVALEVLQLVMDGSLDKTLLPHIHDVLEAVSAKHILEFEHIGAKVALSNVARHLASLLERRGSEAVSAYFLQHGRLTTMERVYDRLFELALVVASAPRSSIDAVAGAGTTMDALTRLEARRTTTDLVDAHFSKSFERVAAALDAMTAVHWTRSCSEQLLLEGLLRGASVETVLASPSPLEQLFRHALESDDTRTIRDDAEGGAEARDDATSSKTSSRRVAYSEVLQALLARITASDAPPGRVVQRLHELLSLSRAAAA